MISFTLGFTNVPAEALYRFAQYDGEWLPEFSRKGEFTPVTFIGVSAQGDLLVRFYDRYDLIDELLFTNRTFESGATYVCDYATREITKEELPPLPGLASIFGAVVDSETGEPLAGALVDVDGYSDHTDLDGIYVIPEIPAGTYSLRFELEGYEPIESTLTLAAGESRELDEAMVPVAAPPPPLPGKFRLWWLIPPAGIVAVAVVATKRKRRSRPR